MPSYDPVFGTKNSYSSLLTYATTAARFLQDIAKSTNSVPFLSVIAGVTILILETVESVKKHKDKCMQMVERICDILSALVNSRGDNEIPFPPAMLHATAEFAETLQKVQSFIRGQQDMGTIKRLLRTAESAVQLEECDAGLTRAVDKFKVHADLTSVKTLLEMQAIANERYRGLVTLLPSRDDTNSSTNSVLTTHSSSSVISLLLPARPKLFHGRDIEMNAILSTLKQASPRLVILGPGGIGKTALALSTLYHPDVQADFQHRHFISCESASSSGDIVSAIAAQIGISESGQTLKAVIRHLSTGELTLLVLDNLETPWEPLESRNDVEALLSRLADISNLAVLVTMRSAERPGQLRWTRPFLQLLKPLSRDAAIKTLSDIVDDDESDETRAQADEVLDFTDNMPLAVTLIGAIASYEGYAQFIARWKLENTSLLSDGHAKSNLDQSIFIFLSNPRRLTSPGSRELLSVLSLLPDDISDTELAMLNLPIANIGKAKSTLLRTSLVYAGDGRLKTLSPVQQYVRKTSPPTAAWLSR
ncbi:P-loop containing nucleoside triphosphate hydrolase protein [Mycena vulgaris]|nr:P-loop containing nucleoside triphosphate hydrolase protein [Mycena vulgaris]